MVFLNDEEKEHVMSKLCSTNRSIDLAMFFVNYSEVSSEDIFEFHYMTKPKFYIEVFKHISNLLRHEAKRGNYTRYAGTLISNMMISYSFNKNRLPRKEYKNRDAIMYVFLKDMLHFLNTEGYIQELNFTISSILDNPDIDSFVLKDIIKSDTSFNNDFIINSMIDSYVFTMTDVLEMLEYRFEFTTNEDILEMLRKIYTTEERLIEILQITKLNHIFVEDRKGNIRVKSRHTGKKKRFFELIRNFLTEVIVAEAEVEMYNYIQGSEYSYSSSKDLFYIDLFSKIADWLKSDDRKRTMIGIFNRHGHEEFKNLLTYDEIIALNNEVNTTRYIYQLEYIDAFRFFIRMFNINRFGFLSYDRAIAEIRGLIKSRIYDLPIGLVDTAVDRDIYNLIMNYE